MEIKQKNSNYDMVTSNYGIVTKVTVLYKLTLLFFMGLYYLKN